MTTMETKQPEVKRFPKSPVLKITVPQTVIDNAIERNSSHCVFADSIKEQVPWAAKVSVDLQTIRLSDWDKGLRYAYLTPREVQRALVLFDQGRRDMLHGFTFKLQKGQIARAGKIARQRADGSMRPPRGSWTRARKIGIAASKRLTPMPDRAVLVRDNDVGSGAVPRRVGGRLPPKLTASSRREFGMRGMSIGYPKGTPENP